MFHLIFDFIALITPNRLPTAATAGAATGATTEYLKTKTQPTNNEGTRLVFQQNNTVKTRSKTLV